MWLFYTERFRSSDFAMEADAYYLLDIIPRPK
jgi:hypothetical protein